MRPRRGRGYAQGAWICTGGVDTVTVGVGMVTNDVMWLHWYIGCGCGQRGVHVVMAYIQSVLLSMGMLNSNDHRLCCVSYGEERGKGLGAGEVGSVR